MQSGDQEAAEEETNLAEMAGEEGRMGPEAAHIDRLTRAARAGWDAVRAQRQPHWFGFVAPWEDLSDLPGLGKARLMADAEKVLTGGERRMRWPMANEGEVFAAAVLASEQD